MPATLALALGAGVRRWLPSHLFVYIMGRGFFATALALKLSGMLVAGLFGAPASLQADDVMLARLLWAFGDAFITGMLISIFVAFRPEWLTTHTDRFYLPGNGAPTVIGMAFSYCRINLHLLRSAFDRRTNNHIDQTPKEHGTLFARTLQPNPFTQELP